MDVVRVILFYNSRPLLFYYSILLLLLLRGTLTDTAVKTAKRQAAEATLAKVSIGDDILENVLTFEYLGSRLQCDGDDLVDVRHRMDIAQAAFGSLSHLWTDHRLSRETKLRLYRLPVCSSLTHCCTAWALIRTVRRMINGFNSRCLHVITGMIRFRFRCIYLVILQTQETSAKTKFGRCRRGHLGKNKVYSIHVCKNNSNY